MTDTSVVIAAYALSLFGGGLLAMSWIGVLRWRIAKKYGDATDSPKDPSMMSLDWSIGIIERAIATTLAAYAPTLLAPFVGGWIALKFAANWQARKQGSEDILAKHRLVALIGSAISFAVAIAMGLLIHPDSATTWTAKPN